MTNANLEKAD